MWMQVVTSHWLFQNSGSASAHLGCTSHFSWLPHLGRREGSGVWQSWAAWPLAKSSVGGVIWPRMGLLTERVQREARAVPEVKGKRAPANYWGQGHAPPAPLIGGCFLFGPLTPLRICPYFTNAFFLFFLHPIASKIHSSNSFSVRSSQQWELYFSYFPSVTVKMQTKPLHPDYTLQIPVLSLLPSNSLAFLCWILVNNDINSPYSYFTIKMAWFLSEDKTM